MAIVYLGLGSNIGERKQNISQAIHALGQSGFVVDAIAPLYVTRARGFDGEEFYNTVVRIETEEDSYDLFTMLKDIEKAMGKKEYPPQPKDEEKVYYDRIIDIDVLLYDDMIAHNSYLTIPHRSIHQRDFVLRPLLDLDAELRCPMTDSLYTELLEQLPQEDKTILDVMHDWHT